MKKQLTFLLLFCIFVSIKANTEDKVSLKIEHSSAGPKVICPGTSKLHKDNVVYVNQPLIPYKDNNSGEYVCKGGDNVQETVYVKFRTCDNCIELDAVSITGLIVGDVVATLVIGVSVYILAKNVPTAVSSPKKKNSDTRRLIPVEMDEPYQPLRHKNGQGDVYNVLRR